MHTVFFFLLFYPTPQPHEETFRAREYYNYSGASKRQIPPPFSLNPVKGGSSGFPDKDGNRFSISST